MKITKVQHTIYDITISILAIIAVSLTIMDLYEGLSGWQIILDRCLLTAFLADYVIRLYLAPDKKAFVRSNICDLIAIFPFYTVFRAFKITRLAKLSTLSRLPRILGFLCRPLRKARRFFNTNGFKYIVFLTTAMIFIGGILIHLTEGMSLSDGVWWAFVTTTTVGYGDISPSTFYGRIIAMVLMLVGIGMIGSITSTLTSYFLNVKAKNVKNETIDSIKAQLDRFDELSPQDVNDICSILKALKSKSTHLK